MDSGWSTIPSERWRSGPSTTPCSGSGWRLRGYGAFQDGELLGIAEGSPESWNHRWRISNLCIFQEKHRRCGVATALMEKMLEEAAPMRMAVLETQTCNERAIAFYRKCGFEIIGFDLYAYTNHDPEAHEVRLEMGKKLI